MIKRFSLISIVTLSLTACGSHQQNVTDLSQVDTTNINQLQNVQVVPITAQNTENSLSNLRIKSLQDTALSIGAQGGLAWASEQINAKLQNDRKYLDNVFNFYALVLNHGVMPPVLEAGDNSLNLADPNTVRVADRTYKIVKQAQFATTPPNWR